MFGVEELRGVSESGVRVFCRPMLSGRRCRISVSFKITLSGRNWHIQCIWNYVVELRKTTCTVLQNYAHL